MLSAGWVNKQLSPVHFNWSSQMLKSTFLFLLWWIWSHVKSLMLCFWKWRRLLVFHHCIKCSMTPADYKLQPDSNCCNRSAQYLSGPHTGAASEHPVSGVNGGNFIEQRPNVTALIGLTAIWAVDWLCVIYVQLLVWYHQISRKTFFWMNQRLETLCFISSLPVTHIGSVEVLM